MQRNQGVSKKPSSTSPYSTSPASFFPIEYQEMAPSSLNMRTAPILRTNSIPFNQTSSVNYPPRATENIGRMEPPAKTNANSNLRVVPGTSKVYFSYINPNTLNVERHYIETVVQQVEKPTANQWELRYFQLWKQMKELISNNQKISEEFLRMREELKISHETALQTSIENFTRAQPPREDNTELRQNYERLKIRLQESQRESSLFKEQNIRMQNMIQKLQSELISEKNLTYKTEIERNQVAAERQKLEYELREGSSQRARLQGEIYELKMVLANKNIEMEQMAAERLQKKKTEERPRSPQKMSQEKFEEKLTRIRGQYQKKQKKFEKLIQNKQKQTSQLRKYILEVQQKQRAARELKQNYEKLYNEKKDQVTSLKKIQQSLLSSNQDERQIVFYQQRINQLNKLAAEQAQRIKQLQKSKAELSKRVEQYQDNYVSQEQLNYLHSVIETNKNQILTEGGINYDELNNKAHTYFNGKIFEDKMLYELKKDNQKLMELMQRINMREMVVQPLGLGSGSGLGMGMGLGSKGNGGVGQDNGGLISMEMQAMIADIFFKLDRISERVKLNSNRNSDMAMKSNRDGSPQKSKRSKESPTKKRRSDQQNNRRDKEQREDGIGYRIGHQLEILKAYIVDLSSTCDRLVKQLEKDYSSRVFQEKQQKQAIKTQIKITEMVPKNQEIIDFYKIKNKELEERVTQLLNLSNTLKDKLKEKHVGENSGEDYWKNQTKVVKQELEELRVRYNKLLAKYQKSEDSKQQFQTKVALFSLQIERLTQQNSDHTQKLHLLESSQKQLQQLKLLKSSLERDLSIQQHSALEMKGKIEEYMRVIGLREKEKGQVEGKLDQALRRVQVLEAEGREGMSKSQMYARNFQSLQGEIQEYRRQMEKLEKNAKSCESLQSTIDELRRKIEMQEKTISTYQQQIQRSDSLLETERRNSSLLQTQANQLRARQEQKASQASTELEAERKRIFSLQQELTQVREFKGKYQEEIRRYSQLEKEFGQIKTKWESETQIVITLKAQLSQITEKLQRSESLLETEKKNTSGLQTENYELRSKLERSSSQSISELEAERKKVTGLQQELSQYRSKYEEESRRYSSLEKEFSQIKLKWERETQITVTLRAQLSQITEKLQRSESLLQSERKSALALQTDKVYSLQQEISQYKSKYEEELRRYSLLQKQFSQLKIKWENESNNSLSLRTQLSQMTERLKAAELALANAQTSASTEAVAVDPYLIEQLRSRTIEAEVLVGELSLEVSNRNKQTKTSLSFSFNQILKLISQIAVSSSSSSSVSAVNSSLDPFLQQKLRSRVIQTEVLLGELNIEISARNKQIKSNMGANFNQILKILSQLVASSSSSSSDRANSAVIEEYSLRIRELEAKISELEKKINLNVETNRFKLEALRSLLIELESLTGEIQLTDDRSRQIRTFINSEVKRGLENVASFDLF